MKEKFERESERRQAALKDYKELELQMTETKTQLKVRDSQLKQTDEENRTLNQVKITSIFQDTNYIPGFNKEDVVKICKDNKICFYFSF